ncbi:helix-turn-helix domain-containing protein, partial [Nonomuraea spiralis]
MGRRERPVDPADGPVAAFAVELRKLRWEAGGLSYRAMAARVPCSAATLAQAAAGDRFPTLPVTLAYVQACGGDIEQWRTRWEEALAAVREATAVGGDVSQAPYRGLARFEAADQAYFFGRTALVERVAELVDAYRLVVVVGPSGCGKSSLLRAGLVPKLRPRVVRVVTPGAHPRAVLPEAAADEVIVVDQFEETFTLCQDPDERQAFIDALVNGQAGRVVLAVRADFFDRCARHPALMEAVRDSTVPVGPMSRSDLREAITKPAAAAGLIVQRELTATVIEEVAGEPGGLPLMSHALLETWRRHHGKALTLADYEATGGIHGAVAHTAETLYTDLPPTHRQRLRELLLRLVTPGEAGTQDTRRPVRRAELLTADPLDPGPVLLERLAAARLITLDDDTADLAHEALLTAWPRL